MSDLQAKIYSGRRLMNLSSSEYIEQNYCIFKDKSNLSIGVCNFVVFNSFYLYF